MRVPCICALRCSIVPISRTRRLSPTTGVVPPLSEKEGFCVHHSLLSCMSNSLRSCTTPSLLPCGRRGTACGGGWRTRWLMRIPCMLACTLRCTVLPISRTRRLSPTASAVPPLSKKEGFCVVLRQLSPFLNLVPYFSLWSTTSNKRF